MHIILHWGDIQDVITAANFWDDRLSSFSVAQGQILGFSIGFRSRPYNTLALPCECVIAAFVIVHNVVHAPICNATFARF